MQNLKELQIIMDENFLKVREESVSSLLETPIIKNVMKKHTLTKQDIENNWADFLNYQEDLQACMYCKSLNDCPKVSRGMQYEMEFQEGKSNLLLKPCPFGEAKFEDENILNNILLKNVDEKLLLTKATDLTMLKQSGGNAKDLFTAFVKYLDHPVEKGFYVYGDAGIGKSTLMGWLVRSLVKTGKQCGFIHFPTFLIDLKSKFGEDGIYESMELMKSLEYLVIDDIGGENITIWSRDEILSAILAYRGQSGKATFFTSNYSLQQISELYNLKNGDTLRVNRLIERMKAVSNIFDLKGKPLR